MMIIMARHTTKHPYWFISIRGSYLPKTWQGWLLYIPYLAYLVGVTWYVLTGYPTLAQAVFILVPNWIAAIVIMTWVAQRTSR